MNASYVKVVEIIRRRIAECEEAEYKYDQIEANSHIPQATLDRKRYAMDAIKGVLKSILEEIGESV